MRKGTLLFYSFDWDDNILKMPTEIVVISDNDEEVGMSTSDFAMYRSKIGKEDFEYKGNLRVGYAEEPFRNFRDTNDPEIFRKDVEKAIRMGNYAPAWYDFIECLTNGSIFSIITARGHESEGMRKGVEYIIDNLSKSDKHKMHDSLLMFLHLYSKNPATEKNYESIDRFSKSELVSRYLDLCHFVGVSAPSRSGSVSNPEEAKEHALRDFIRDVNNYAKKIGYSAKVGFSDDDPGNVRHMTNALSSKDLNHEKLWPYISEFTIKDTNKPHDVVKTKIPTRVKTFRDFNESTTPGLEASIIPFENFNNLVQTKPNDRFSANGDENRQDAYGNRLKEHSKHLSKKCKCKGCKCKTCKCNKD